MGCATSAEGKSAGTASPPSSKPQKQPRGVRKRKDGALGQSLGEGTEPSYNRKKGRPRPQRKNDAAGNPPVGSETSEFLSSSPSALSSKRKKAHPHGVSSKIGVGKSRIAFTGVSPPTSPAIPTSQPSPSFKPCTSTESGNLQDLMHTLKASSFRPPPAPDPADDGLLPLPSFPPTSKPIKSHVNLGGAGAQSADDTPQVVFPVPQQEADLGWIHDSSDSQSEKNQDSGSAKARRRSTSIHHLSTSSFGRIVNPPAAVADLQPRGGSENTLLTRDWCGRPGGQPEKNKPNPTARDRSSGSSPDRLHRSGRAAATSSSSAFSDSRGDSSVGLFFQAEAERRCSNQGYEKLEPIDPQWWKTTYQRVTQRGAPPQANPFLVPGQTTEQPLEDSRPAPDASAGTSRATRVTPGEAPTPENPAQVHKISTWFEGLNS